ncbi:hypothetical protein PLEOSDRAFT_1100554 [Pleurotus ostreatus PC15]|uniref:Uncharacterized protein n=1 Tax=Pleurotus ostreatus (strain PC15) TaxID=1137138 RepID=A0A067P6I6_PLEO1|nr:hypothetical protein PLEOSDRAFT_1100554 [Pleurotus ostreatus PC15]
MWLPRIDPDFSPSWFNPASAASAFQRAQRPGTLLAAENMPSLPPEIIRKGKLSYPSYQHAAHINKPVFVHVGNTKHRSALLPLALVCKETQTWMTPLLYHSVHLTKARHIRNIYEAFHHSASLIQHLWIGPVDGTYNAELDYGSPSWPVVVVHDLLALCSNLRSLTIINLSQNLFYQLADVIPASIESLSMGPIHGPLILGHLMQRPRIRNFTSGQSYMRDDEVQDIILSPYLRRFRRIGLGSAYSSAVAQSECVSVSRTLEEMQIVLCGQDRGSEVLERIMETTLRSYTDDKRVSVTPNPLHDWISVLFEEFQFEYTIFVGTIVDDL